LEGHSRFALLEARMRATTIRIVLAALMTVTMACSSSAGGNLTAADFIGTWKYLSGASTRTCAGVPTTATLSGFITLNQGNAANTVVVLSNGCTETYTVSGDRASAAAGESCTQTQGGETVDATVTTDDLMLSGGALVEKGSGSALITRGGQSVTCLFTVSASLIRFN
jgi:hypothetical protein